ncbi:SASA family carbohydrate esterase [Escherichia coli]|uniref:SASA family carbohydrate esterase n=1 Tax=Escherichia coli TaxID=562 RepID=UPI0006CA89D0|nr:SASA family carbohydrate esterase [Escherichia coli]
MAFKHYDVVRAASPSDLAEKLTHKLKEGWQPFGSPVAITPYTLMQAIAAEGDVVVSGATEPEWYYVIVLAGQSNAMAYGEGLPLPDSYDAPHPRIKQLARRNTVTPGGEVCVFNDIIPADHCLHDVAGILLVPCCRGGSAFTQGTEGTFSESTGASQDSARWGVGKPLYQDLLFRTKAALQKNPKNVLLAICWMQGEFDMTNASYAQQPAAFLAMVQQFRADLAGLAAQCHGGSPASVPWICGDTTYAWKQEHGTQYEVVYGAYKGKESQQIYFVPFMTDGSGVNTPTNNPSEDPDIAGSGYYGSASRTNKNWVSSNRPTHFSSWARRGIIPDRMATAILNVAGRTLAFISGKAPEIKPSPGGDTPSGPSDGDTSVRTVSLLPTAGEAAAQGWTITGGSVALEDGVFKVTKQSNKTWSLMHPVDDAVSLLTRGGRLSCKFRLSGALTNNQFGLGIYLCTDVALPDVVAMTGTGNPFLMSFFTQTTDGKLNLMHHRKAGNTKLGEFGNYSNDWQTLELVFTAGSATVTPKLNGVAGPAFQVIKDSLTLGLNALTLTDITKNAAYGVEIESLVLEINAPASS